MKNSSRNDNIPFEQSQNEYFQVSFELLEAKTKIQDLEKELAHTKALNNVLGIEQEIQRWKKHVDHLQYTLDEIYSSNAWKLVRKYYRLKDIIKHILKLPIKQSPLSIVEYTENENSLNIEDSFSPEEQQILLNKIKYSIDRILFVDFKLIVQGWIFTTDNTHIDINIEIRAGDQIFSFPVNSCERKDVYNVFNTDASLYSGFHHELFIEYSREAEIRISIKQYGMKAFIECGKVAISPELTPVGSLVAKIYPERHTPLSSDWEKKSTVVGFDFDPSLYKSMVDVIIPVYNGFEYLENLFDSITKTKIKYRLIVIDDNSTDKRVWSFLKRLQSKFKNMMLQKNNENLGFVHTVNKMLKQCKNNVALLNTDIELPDKWLERLMLPIFMDETVASATPFSNSATLMGFPNIGDNPLIKGKTLADIDNVFKLISPKYAEIPTGVGFCMALNHKVILEIGTFDDITFKRGYGEENDWCCRAAEAGYKNVAVENLFVWHKHGGSFTSEEKKELIATNGRELEKKHPYYNIVVRNFLVNDILQPIRAFSAIQLLSGRKKENTFLYITNSLGGGSESYLKCRLDTHAVSGDTVFVLRYLRVPQEEWKLEIYFDGHAVTSYYLSDYKDMAWVFDKIDFGTVYINQFATYKNIPEKLNLLSEWRKTFGFCLIFLLHDYFSVCPKITLLDNNNSFCDIPNDKRCVSCLNVFEDDDFAGTDINNYQKYWKEFLGKCDNIIAFSEDTKRRINRIYPKLKNIIVNPHRVDYVVPLPDKRYKRTKTINIGVIGALSAVSKGGMIIRDMIKILEEKSLDVKIILLGHSELMYDSPYIIESGRYLPEQLPNLTLKYDIDIFFISSIWAETFSYTAQEVMEMRMPVACFDIGAPSERIRKYEKGVIIPQMNAQHALDVILMYYNTSISLPNKRERLLFIVNALDFTQYRAKNFAEQLWMQGVDSAIVPVADLDKIDILFYDAIILCQSQINDKIYAAVETFRTLGRKVLYDIDDLIVDLNGLKKSQDEDFKDSSQKVYECMLLCDGFITSTEQLAGQIAKYFPNKTVCVKHNAANLEMQGISRYWRKVREHKRSDDIVLGYFSESNADDNSFALISDEIHKIMRKYTNTRLIIGGFLKLGQEFKEFGDRVHFFQIEDHRNLLKRLSEIDIFLMPLENTEFHKCKPENKWTEAGLLKVPSIASRNTELEKVIDDKKNGFLCSTSDEWYNTLTKLVTDDKLRESVGETAFEQVMRTNVTQTISEDVLKYISLYNQ